MHALHNVHEAVGERRAMVRHWRGIYVLVTGESVMREIYRNSARSCKTWDQHSEDVTRLMSGFMIMTLIYERKLF